MRFLSLIISTFTIFYVSALSSLSQCAPVYVALHQQNTDKLKNILRLVSDPVSPQYGNWLTSKKIHEIIDPPDIQQTLVMSWINEYSTHNIKNHGDAISFCARQSSLVDMFQIPIIFDKGNLVLNKYSIPDNLSHIIDFVEMYVSKDTWRIKQETHASSIVDDRYFGLEPMQSLYSVPQTVINTTIKTAAIEFQGNQGYTNVDMNMQRVLNGMTKSGVVKDIGGNVGVDVESELDIQMLSMANGNTELWYWNNPYWLYSFAVEFEKTLEKPNIISLSWGWSERNQCDIIDCVNIDSKQYVSRVNVEFLKMALQGTTIVVSSGDAGAPGRTNEECSKNNPINPVFPGSSPYVLSVGATYVVNDNSTHDYKTPLCQNNTCTTGATEGAVSYDHVGWTAGGGFDAYHNATPWWQESAVKNYVTSGVILPPLTNFNIHGRAYPDIAAVGHNCPTVVMGQLGAVDGTSCSAPLVGGLLTYVWNELWNSHNIKLGFANPLLYHIQENCPECFRDIKTGYNWCTEGECCGNPNYFGFSATDGYDPVAGLGTPNINKIADYIKNKIFR